MEVIDGVPLTGPLPVEKAVARAGFFFRQAKRPVSPVRPRG